MYHLVQLISNDYTTKKINAAKMALKRIRPGMCVGLGTGSTTNEFINLLGQEKQLLKTLRYASSSIQTEMFAKKYSVAVCYRDLETCFLLHRSKHMNRAMYFNISTSI